MTQTCNYDHEHHHGEKTTCYHYGGCRCVSCMDGVNRRQQQRRKDIAYGRYVPMQDARGARRRIQGLQLMGWRLEDIGNAAGLCKERVHTITKSKHVTARVHNSIATATRTLMARGSGPSKRAANNARNSGWVPLLAWDDLDGDEEPQQHDTVTLAGDELIDEIEWLQEGGMTAEGVAFALGKTPYALERMALRRGRSDLASFFYYARKRAAA